MFGKSRTNKWYIPLVIILVSVALFALYYFFYVSWQRNYANERAFRLLSVVGDQLGKRFDNLKNILAASLVSSTSQGVSNYLTGIAKYKPEEVSVKDSLSPCPSDWKREGDLKLQLINNPKAFSLSADFLPFKPGTSQPESCHLSVEINPSLDLRERFHSLTADYFDDILLATSDGEVLFESNTSGLRITNLNTMIAAKGGSSSGKLNASETSGKTGSSFNQFQDATQFSNVIEVKLAGTNYKLYIQPVPLRIGAAEKDGHNLKIIVCGLWRADRLESEVVSIPYSTLIWSTLLMLAVFGLIWPLLKVAYMSPSERLKRAQVYYLLSSALFVTAVLTLIVLNAAYMLDATEEANEQLASLAARINDNLKTELARALDLMNSLEKDGSFRLRLQTVTSEDWTDVNFLNRDTKFFGGVSRSAYPYFDSVFWTDTKGNQLYKLTVQSEATPKTQISEESFFQDLLNRRNLLTLRNLNLSDGKSSIQGIPEETSKTPFRFESRYSPNTGEYIVLLAKPSDPFDPSSRLQQVNAQVLVTRFVSLVDPVVPSGFGYALVDHEGLVHFHSSASRNLIENFLKECREDPVLKTFITNGSKGYLDVDYMGRQQGMIVEPLPCLTGSGLSLIVFRDTNYFTTINVACMLLFALLALVFSVPFLIGLALQIFRAGAYPLANLWPTSSQNPSYLRIIVANACIAVAFALHFPTMGVYELLKALLAIVAGAAFFRFVGLKWVTGRRSLMGGAVIFIIIVTVAGLSKGLLAAGAYTALSVPPISAMLQQFARKSKRLKHLYLGVVLSLLAVLIVVPCFALFRISYHTVNRLALESAQLDRLDLLTHRADHIRQYFSSVKTKPETACFRLNDTLDRYDTAISWPADAEAQNPSDVQAAPAFERWMATVAGLFPGTSTGAQLRGVALADSDSQSRQHWHLEQNSEDEVLRLSDLPPDIVPERELKAVFPIWHLQLQAMVLMLLLAVVLATWLGYMIRKVFLIDLAKMPPLQAWELEEMQGRNLIVIGHPKSGKGTRAAALDGVDMLDLAKAITGADWTLPDTNPTVVVNHFEFDIDNPDTCLAKLTALEKLLNLKKKRVILLSAVDPMFYLASSSPEIFMSHGEAPQPPAQILDRWAEVLSNFEKVQMRDVTEKSIDEHLANRNPLCQKQLASLVKAECNHTAQLRKIGIAMLDAHCNEAPVSRAAYMEELMDRADSYYRVVLSTCTKEERLVLFQLARDGWANPKNERAIQQLERRRIIRRAPGIRIMNESLCSFVRTAQLPGEVANWEQEEKQSVWSAVKLGLSTALLTGGAWLLYTQQDVFQLGIGYLAALGTATGVILNLAKSIWGGKSGGSAAPDANAS